MKFPCECHRDWWGWAVEDWNSVDLQTLTRLMTEHPHRQSSQDICLEKDRFNQIIREQAETKWLANL